MPSWDLIHGFTGEITAFSLMLAFASYSDEDYYKCIDYIKHNCNVTSNGMIQLSKPLDEIRSSKYFDLSIPADARIRKQLKNIEC